MINNDWIVANINNPDTSPEMLKSAGFNTDNTQLLDEDKYLKSNFIIQNPMFQKDGQFSRDLFDTYYKQQVTKWADLQKDKQTHQIYDMFDVRQNPGDTIVNPLTGNTKGLQTDAKHPFGEFLKLTPNITNQGISVSGFNVVSPQTKSIREIAEGQNIFDSDSNTFTNDTPDSIALFSNPIKYFKQLFSDPLVLATYDSDGEHKDPFTGDIVKHNKGDYKLNDNGKPFYETLNGRNPANKQVLSMGDIITPETSSINKYDFIDSDDMDKSITGVVLKNLATVVPLAIPYVGEIYSGAIVARELAKTTPMLYGIIKSLFSDEAVNSPVLNTVQAYAQQLTGSSSDYANSKVFTLEGTLNMMGDVATQWGQQQAVAKWTRKLLSGKTDLLAEAEQKAHTLYNNKLAELLDGVDESKRMSALMNYGMDEAQAVKLLEAYGKPASDAWKMTTIGSTALRKTMNDIEPQLQKLNRLGANASLAYMAAVSNTDVYQSMLDNGATPREAAAVAFGSTLGMYTVDRLGIGELFFDELKDGRERAIRAAIKGEGNNWTKALHMQVASVPEDTNKFKKLILQGRNKTVKILQDYADDIKYHTTGFVGKAIGEGLEEVSEELVADTSKATYAMLHNFGLTTQAHVGEFNYDPNMNDGKGGYNIGQLLQRYGMNFFGGTLGGGLFYGVGVVKGNNWKVNKDSADMLYLIRDGKGEDLVQHIENFRKKGKFGSTTISASRAQTDEDGNNVNITIDGDESVNDYIAKRLTNQVRAYQTIMDDNNLNRTDEELFNHMIMQDKVLRNLQGFLQDKSYITRYQQTWQALANEVIIAQKGLEVAASSKNGEIPKDLIEQLGTAASSKEIIDKLGDARLMDSTERHNSGEEAKRAQNVTAWQDYLNTKKQQLADFESPENSSYYTEMLMFAIDPIISSSFGSYDFNSWLYNNYHGLTADKLTQEELTQLKTEYQNYINNAQPMDLQDSFKLYKDWQKKVDPKLQEMANASWNYDSWQKQIDELFNEGTTWLITSGHPEVKQSWETVEEFEESRQKDGESSEEYLNRTQARRDKIQQKVDEKLQELENFVKTQFLDPVTARQIKVMMGARIKDLQKLIVNNNLSRILNPRISELFSQPLKDFDGKSIEALQNQLIEKLDKWSDSIKRQFIYVNALGGNKLLRNNPNTFSQILIDDLIHQNIDESALYGKGTKEQKILSLLTSITGLSENYESNVDEYKGRTYGDIIKSIWGEDVYNRLNNSQESFTQSIYDEDAGMIDVPIYYINPFKYIANNEEITPEIVDNWIEQHKDISNEVLSTLKDIVPSDKVFNDYLNDIHKSFEDNYITNIFNDINQDVYDNKIIQVLSNIDVDITNPITELAKTLPIYNDTVESIIEKMYQHFEDVDDVQQFILTPEETEALPQVALVLNMASAYINAASSDQDINNIYGHNKTINRFNQEHQVKAEPLAEIDKRFADIYQIEIGKYLNQISSDTLSLPRYSLGNQGNIIGQFDRAKEALDSVKHNFWKTNQNSFTIGGINLLNGYTEDMSTKEVENLFYDNFHKAILDGTTDLETIIDQFTQNILNQETANLNGELTYAKFNNYDKLSYLIATLGIRTDDYLSFVKEEIKKYDSIVPLDSQLYTARIGIASINNPSLINKLLNRIKEVSNIQIPTLNRILFISGIGGSGKTSVVAKYITDYASNKKLIVAGPTKEQAKSLNKSLGINSAITAKELMSLVIDDANYKPLNEIQQKDTTSEKTLAKLKIDDDVIKSHEPGILLFDEVTHLSTLDLMLLDKWATKNDINIIGLGDDTQAGYEAKTAIFNIDTDNVFCLRTPRLSISLRNANVQQAESTKTLYDIVQNLRKLATSNNKEAFNRAKNSLANYTSRYNLGEELHGTIITNKFSAWDKIPKNASIAYIGDNSIPSEFTNVSTFLDITSVQGQEFDYIIYDKPDIEFKDAPYEKIGALGETVSMARKLYTIISRGKKGAVIISPNSGYSSREDSFTGVTTDFSTIAEDRRQNLLDELESYNLTTSSVNTAASNNANQNTPAPNTASNNTSGSSQPSTPSFTGNMNNALFSIDDDTIDSHLQKENSAASNNDAEIASTPSENTFDRCYANFSLLGVQSSKIKDKNVWILPSNNSSLSDIGVIAEANPFITKGRFQISDGDTKDQLVRELIALKQALLSVNNSGTKIDWNNFSAYYPQFNKYFNKESFDNLKYYVKLRAKQDGDTLVGFPDLSNDKVSFNYRGKELVAVITAEWDYNGSHKTLTLGALPNPSEGEAYYNYAKEHPTAPYANYVAQFNEILNNENGVREIDAPNRMVTILKHSNSLIPFARVQPQQTWISKNGAQTTGTLSNADTINKAALLQRGYLSVSEPLIYMGGIEGVNDDAMKGQLVYLVSATPNMSSEQMVDTYYKAKAGIIKEDYMKVRMITPTQRGLSFQDMTNQIWRNFYVIAKSDNQSANNFPQNAAQLGLRMYAHLWNTRANLINILRALDSNPNNDLHMFNQFRLLNPKGLTNKDLQYYIGWDTKDRDAAYKEWQKTTSYEWDENAEKGSEQYNTQRKFINYQNKLKESNPKKLKSYIYATREYMEHIKNVSDAMLEPFKDLIQLKQENGELYPQDQIITCDNNKHSNDIRKLFLHSTSVSTDYEFAFPTYNDQGDRKDIIVQVQQDVFDSEKKLSEDRGNKYNAWAVFKMVPLVLTKNYRLVSIAKSTNPNGLKLFSQANNAYKFKYKNSEGKQQVLKLNTQPLIDVANGLSSMTDFANITDLIFHGTTDVQGIQLNKKTGIMGVNHRSFRESSAPFRWGIWTNPLIDFDDNNKITIEPSTGNFISPFLRVRNADGINHLFMSDVIPIPLADISLDKKKTKSINTKPVEVSKEQAEFNAISQLSAQLGLNITKGLNLADTIKDYNKKLNQLNLSESNVNQITFKTLLEDGTVKNISVSVENIKDIFNFTTGENTYAYTYADVSNNSLTATNKTFIVDSDGNIKDYEFNSMNQEEKQRIIKEAFENDEVKERIYAALSEYQFDEEGEPMTVDKFKESIKTLDDLVESIKEAVGMDYDKNDVPYAKAILDAFDENSCTLNLI